MAGLRLRINIGNGGKASSSSLAAPAQRGEHPQGIVREIHYDPLHGGQFAQGHALDRQLNGPLRGVQHQLAQPAGGQRAGREDIIGHH
ncbi:hypothetical protein IE987_24900 [Klebsiella pneumoniae]|uniref:Uncharacterized protein n=1 Tax=Klebsiella pneumoniae TaxID=573 RepID=A0A927DL20_KLEPN|nr:hypothetical protein [Klebsiella pneumoniae]